MKKDINVAIIYFALVSLGVLAGFLISLGTLTYSALEYNLITDEEYLAQNHWEIDRCEDPKHIGEKTEEKTPEEIMECKEKAEKSLAIRRRVNLKETIIGSSTFGLIFLIVFLIHFPVFRKKYNQK